MKKINPKELSKNYSEERCNFLEGELKKIEAQIKTVKTYSKEDIKYQKELWTLRDNIIKQIGLVTPPTLILTTDETRDLTEAIKAIKDELEIKKNNKNI